MWTISAASATQVSEIDRSAASSRAVRACVEWWIRAGNERIGVSFSCLQIRRICVSTAFPTGPGRCRRRRTRFLRSRPNRRSASTLRATACSAATGSHSSRSTLTRGSSPSLSSTVLASTPTTGTNSILLRMLECWIRFAFSISCLLLRESVECLFLNSLLESVVSLTSLFAFFFGELVV